MFSKKSLFSILFILIAMMIGIIDFLYFTNGYPLSVSVAQAAYSIPKGIPDPRDAANFGGFDPIEGTINQTTYCPNWPSTQNSISGGDANNCYYIDNTTACNDTNAGGYGTPNSPRCTIPTGTKTEGDYIYINAGTYSASGDRVTLIGSGTASKPIWFQGNAANKPILTKFIHLGNGGNSSYIVIENIKFIPSTGYVTGRPTAISISVDHIVVRNCEFDGSTGDYSGNTSMISFGNSSSYAESSVSYIVAYNNIIHDVGDWSSEEGAAAGYQDGRDPVGYYADKGSNHHWVINNTFYRIGSDAIAGAHTVSADYPVEYYYIGRNTIYRNDENGIDLKGAGYVVISENTIYGPWTDSPGEAIILHYGANSIGVYKVAVIFNKIFDSAGGIYITMGSDVDIIGNLIYNIKHDVGTYVLTGAAGWSPDPNTSAYAPGAAIHYRGFTGTARIVDNTLYNYDIGIQSPNPAGTFKIHGNIFAGRVNPSLGWDIFFSDSVEVSRVDMNYNIFSQGTNNVRIGWGGTTVRDLAYMQGIGECSNCLSADPLFVNPGTDFNLQSNSPAKNVNVEGPVGDSAYDAFSTLFGVSIKKDFVGTTRPQGVAWDIGAYEYVESTPPPDTTPPSAPTGLAVI